MNAINIASILTSDANNLVTPELVQCHRTYGVTGRPMRVTSAFRIGSRTIGQNHVVVEKWMLVNARTNTAIFVTTHNGRAGWDFDPAANTYALDFSMCLRTIRGCSPVAIEQCPVAVTDTTFMVKPS